MTGVARAPRAAWRGALLVACCAWAAGCAQLATTDQTTAAPAQDSAFALSGRLSARRGSDGIAANVRWNHAPRTDTLDLATPLGQILARMARTPAGVSIEMADGQRQDAASFDALTAAAFGVPIPVDGLAFWIRASAHPRSAYHGERDSAGRLQTLDQDGWAIVYAYPDDTDTLPRRVTLAYPGIDLRIVIDDWH